MADGLFYVDSRAPFISGDVPSSPMTMATTAKALIPAANIPVLGANYFSFIGKAMRIRLFGRITTASSPGNITMQIMYGTGADNNGVVLAATTTIALLPSQSNASWQCEYLVRCRTMGATGTLFATGTFQANTALIASTAQPIMIPATAPAASAACDLTVSLLLSPQVLQSGTAGTVQVHDVLYEALN
jgi:hypothetical protein